MKSVKIQANKTHIKGNILLPASKSISNRALILKAICAKKFEQKISLINLSEAEDTLLLQQFVSSDNGTVNIKNAGTCARFLCAYFAATEGTDIILEGEPRMHERPIAPLVEALRQLGADIDYRDKEGFLPLAIKGKKLTGGNLQISAKNSSQFVSALMLISPLLGGGLNLTLEKESVSKSYIQMTAGVMQDFGFDIQWDETNLQISYNHVPLHKCIEEYEIEADWSSAAFFYEAALLAEEANLLLQGLKLPSLQGDAILTQWFEKLGVKSELVQTGIKISKTAEPSEEAHTFDFENYPDLAPALVCACAGAGIALKANGIQSLVFKESNRIESLIKALETLHIKVDSDRQSFLAHDGIQKQFYHGEILDTQKDHRLAMAFAMMALFFSQVRITESKSVVKSFPNFWLEAEKIGLELG